MTIPQMTVDPFAIAFAAVQFVSVGFLGLLSWNFQTAVRRLEELERAHNALQLAVAQHHPTKAELATLREEIREIVADAVKPLATELAIVRAFFQPHPRA